MRFFQISIVFILLLVSSCNSITKDYILTKKTTSTIKNSYFSDTSTDYIYKAKIDVYGNYFGGIIIIKKLTENHHRIVFTTEFGTKFFDFEINNNQFIKNYVAEQLNRKIIINTLKKDFEILLQENNTVSALYTDENFKIYESPYNTRYNFYFVNTNSTLLEKITHTTKHKEKIAFTFNDIKPTLAKKINIEHKNIKLNINLNYINN